MANPSYINRFIDILRSPLGQPLLNQLAASSDKLAALLYFPAPSPPPAAQEPGAPQEPAPQVSAARHVRLHFFSFSPQDFCACV